MIGTRLTELRSKHDMTQEEFAERLDVSRQAVSKWELDKTLPDVNKLLKISELYKVSLDYLLKGIENTENEVGVDADGNLHDKNDEEEEIVPSDEDTESIGDEKKKCVRFRLKMSIVLVSILLLGITGIMMLCIISQVWNKSGSDKTPVRVDKISAQYSVADVSCYTEEGTLINKTIFLDTNGVRVGDYIYCYVDGNRGNLYVDHSVKSMACILIIFLLLLLIWVLLVREIRV